MPTLGITGGVASGKSLATRLFVARGARAVSADDLAREVTAPGTPVTAAIADAFGPGFLLPDGSLDRAGLGRLVFADPAARRRLEELTHPAILCRLRDVISDLQRTRPGGLVVAEVPLLFEAGMEGWFDHVLTVACSRETQMRRLAERDGLSPADAEARVGAQMPLEEKAARSRIVIWNEGDTADLAARVSEVYDRLARGA